MAKSTSFNSSSAGQPAHRVVLSWAVTIASGLAVGALGLYFGLAIITGDGAEADLDSANACEQQAREFADYPLLYAGSEVLGYELVGCRHNKTEDRFAPDGTRYHNATDSFTFVYGSCVIPSGGSSCPIPVSIIMYPACHSSLAAGAAKDTALVRGAQALVKSDGSLRIEAPSHKLTLYAPGNSSGARTANAIRVAEALVPANAPADALSRGAPLSTTLGGSKVCS